MNTLDIAHANDPDLRNSLAAMKRAALDARQIAMQTNTGIVIVRNNQLIHVSAEELRQAELAAQSVVTM